MEHLWSAISSPITLGILALYWLLKLTVGTWVVRKIYVRLPETARYRARNFLNFRRGDNVDPDGKRDMKWGRYDRN